MTTVTQTTATPATEITTATTAIEITAVAMVPATPKAPSKKSLATTIFQTKLTERKQGLFTSNKAFRAAVLDTIKTELGVSTASAATMYNSAKVEAEAADTTIALGRDPKQVKAISTGVKGRKPGSKNTPKVAAVAGDATVAVVTDAVAPAADTVVTIDVAAVADTAPAEVAADAVA